MSKVFCLCSRARAHARFWSSKQIANLKPYEKQFAANWSNAYVDKLHDGRGTRDNKQSTYWDTYMIWIKKKSIEFVQADTHVERYYSIEKKLVLPFHSIYCRFVAFLLLDILSAHAFKRPR